VQTEYVLIIEHGFGHGNVGCLPES